MIQPDEVFFGLIGISIFFTCVTAPIAYVIVKWLIEKDRTRR